MLSVSHIEPSEKVVTVQQPEVTPVQSVQLEPSDAKPGVDLMSSALSQVC